MKIYEEDPYEVCPMIAVHGCAECPLNEQCHRKEKETELAEQTFAKGAKI